MEKIKVQVEVDAFELYNEMTKSYHPMEMIRSEVFTLDDIDMAKVKEIVPIEIELSDIVSLIAKSKINYKDAIIVVQNPDGEAKIENYIIIVDMDGFKNLVLNEFSFLKEEYIIYKILKKEFEE